MDDDPLENSKVGPLGELQVAEDASRRLVGSRLEHVAVGIR
jgi:hypothetical protein